MTTTSVTPPLWRQLQLAAQVCAAVQAGSSGTALLDQVDPVLRPGVQALCFHAWRHWGQAQVLRSLLVSKTPPPTADALLCVALSLLADGGSKRYDAFTLVNQTVEAAKRQKSTQAQSNFLNACLRRFVREEVALKAESARNPVAVWNHPLWWINKVRKDHPDRWEAILAAANRHAPMTLRANARRVTAQAYAQQLAEVGVAASLTQKGALELTIPTAVQALPGFQGGLVSVQDAAAQLAAPLLLHGLPLQGAGRILDACAAPGGKTGHLLELTDAAVVALEVDAARAQRIHDNLKRLGLSAQVLVADAEDTDNWWDGIKFDGILLDAPCTASGIVRRHPDIRWLRREGDVAQLAQAQRRLLQALWPLLQPGGRILFCTCSIFEAEGAEQVQSFLANNSDAILCTSPGHLLPGVSDASGVVHDNPLGDHDGFFYALFEKRAG
jgi:16S rRNA (cytosine967-C5)-methyltransferase